MTSREFPVQVKVEDWSLDNSDVYDYVQALLIQSGGAGIGLGIVMMLIMFICIVLFFCCPCCCFKTCCMCCRWRNPRWKERTNRNIGAILLIVCLLISCTGIGLLYPSTITTLDDGYDAVSNVRATMESTMDFMCGDPLTSALVGGQDFDNYTAGKTAAEMCTTTTSISYFVTDLDCKVTSTLESIEERIDGFSSIVDALDVLAAAYANFSNGVSLLNETLWTVDTAGNSLTTSVADYNTFVNPASCNAPALPTDDFPTVDIDDGTLADASGAASDVETEGQTITDARDEAYETITVDLQATTQEELNTTKTDILSDLQSLQSDLLDFVDSINTLHGDVGEYQEEYYAEYRDYVLLGYLLFNGISVMALMLILIGFLCCKSNMVTECGACCIFFMTVVMCTLLGISVLGWLITGDLCDNWFVGNEASNYEGIFEVNLGNETIEFGNTTVNIGNGIENVLFCESGCVDIESTCSDLPASNLTNEGCDDTNNLVGILSLDDAFNFSSEIQPSIDDILDYAPQLDFSDEFANATAQLYSSLMNTTLNYTIVYNETELETGEASLESLRSQAPSCGTATCTESGDPLSTAECDKWQAIWNVGNNLILPGSTCSCTYLDGSNPADYSNTFWKSNCELLERINAISGHMTTLNESVYVFEVAQGILDTSRDAVASAIGGVDTATSAAEQSLYVMAQLLVNLADYIVEEAPSHTQCSWIATAWQTNIETDYCMHVYDNLRNLIIGMAFCSVGMILGFFVSLDLANPHRLRPRALSEQDSNATGKKSSDNVGPQSSIQWDHPLAHPDGVVDPVTGRIRMISPGNKNKYWNKEDYASNVDLGRNGALGPLYPNGPEYDGDDDLIVNVTSAQPIGAAGFADSSSDFHGL